MNMGNSEQKDVIRNGMKLRKELVTIDRPMISMRKVEGLRLYVVVCVGLQCRWVWVGVLG